MHSENNLANVTTQGAKFEEKILRVLHSKFFPTAASLDCEGRRERA